MIFIKDKIQENYATLVGGTQVRCKKQCNREIPRVLQGSALVRQLGVWGLEASFGGKIAT
jgi:hypothetical protein